MGLDMYLSAVTVPNRISLAKRELRGGRGSVTEDERADFKEEGSTVQVAYWRKVNCVHNWFVENCQGGEDDCGEYVVSREQLEALLRTVKAVLKDHSQAMALLPPQAGFFFGSTEIDQYYFSDLEDTEDQLERVLADQITNGYHHFIYQSSW